MSTTGYTVAPNGTDIASLGWMLEPNGTYGHIADENVRLSRYLSIDDPANLDQCTLTTCTLAQAHFDYVPSLAGNSLYTAIFGLALIAQLFFGIRYKTWGFMAAMFGGLVLEVVGYVSRIQMSINPFTSNPFLMYVRF